MRNSGEMGSGHGRLRRCVVLVAATALSLTGAAAASAAAPPSGQHIPGRYIVVLKGALPAKPTTRSEHAVTAEVRRVAASVHAKPLVIYNVDLRGFAAHLTRSQVRRLRRHPRVKYVEQDERIAETDVQSAPSWALDRIDQRALPLDLAYRYPSSAGNGVTAYVIDTGIQANHPDFGTRASFAKNTVDSRSTDGNGHGTHVAGIIGGTTYGVAKQVKLVGVKVLSDSGSGSTSGVISGMEWVVKHAVTDKSVNRSVVNMSLGGGVSPAMDAAAANMVREGLFLVVAGGNDNKNACNYSPAAAPAAFTVGATDNADRKASFSNFGTCIDAFAPGVSIASDWIAGGTNAISGTSMSAPFVAGVVALYLADHPGTPAAVTTWLNAHMTRDVVANIPTTPASPNRLIFAGDL